MPILVLGMNGLSFQCSSVWGNEFSLLSGANWGGVCFVVLGGVAWFRLVCEAYTK